MAGNNSSAVSRRSFLGAAAATAGLFVAGCGDSGGTAQSQIGTTGSPSSSGSPSSTGSATGAPKRGGSLRYVPDDFAIAVSQDPVAINTSTAVKTAMYETLVDTDSHGRVFNVLAEEFSATKDDQTQWVIRLKDGVEFHNGKTLDADDVIFTIGRMIDPKNPTAAAGLMTQLRLENVKKVDKRTVQLTLDAPNSHIWVPFTGGFGAIVPVGFDPNKPVGTGPFRSASFQPRQRWTGTRFENYWQDGKPYLDQVELFGFNDQTAAVNALVSKQVDAVSRVGSQQMQQVKAASDLATLIDETAGCNWFDMACRQGAPFEDPRVRQAFKLMVDRQQLVDTVMGGLGGIGNDVMCYPEWDPGSDPSVEKPFYQHDPDQARALLKAAGKDGMTVKVRTGATKANNKQVFEVLEQQAKKVGVTLTLDWVADTTTFYDKGYFQYESQIEYDYAGDVYSNCIYYWVSTADYNSTGYKNPEVDRLYDEVLRVPMEQSYDKQREISKIIAQDGPWIVWGKQNVVTAFAPKIKGIQKDYKGLGVQKYAELWSE